jgi:hypothetical protein
MKGITVIQKRQQMALSRRKGNKWHYQEEPQGTQTTDKESRERLTPWSPGCMDTNIHKYWL